MNAVSVERSVIKGMTMILRLEHEKKWSDKRLKLNWVLTSLR